MFRSFSRFLSHREWLHSASNGREYREIDTLIIGRPIELSIFSDSEGLERHANDVDKNLRLLI